MLQVILTLATVIVFIAMLITGGIRSADYTGFREMTENKPVSEFHKKDGLQLTETKLEFCSLESSASVIQADYKCYVDG